MCSEHLPGHLPAARLVLAAVLLVLLAACGAEAMEEQPRLRPLEPSEAFADGQSARPLNPQTVPREAPAILGVFESGEVNGEPVEDLPLPLTEALLLEGREQYNIYCSPCHGIAGFGDGMVVQRGFPPASSFHTQRLRQAPAGYIFDVITNGTGDMYGYGARVEPADRWAIVAYIRVLQMSQHLPVERLAPEEQELLPAPAVPAPAGGPDSETSPASERQGEE